MMENETIEALIEAELAEERDEWIERLISEGYTVIRPDGSVVEVQ